MEDDASLEIEHVDSLLHGCRHSHGSVGVGNTMATHKFVVRSCGRGICGGLIIDANCCDFCAGSSLLTLAPLHKTCTEIVDNKRQEQAGHEDGRGRGLVFKDT